MSNVNGDIGEGKFLSKFFFNFEINLFLILGEEITEEKYNNFATDDEINPYSPEHQFKLTKALNVLHIKPSTFHSYYTSGKYHKVHIWNFYISISLKEGLEFW